MQTSQVSMAPLFAQSDTAIGSVSDCTYSGFILPAVIFPYIPIAGTIRVETFSRTPVVFNRISVRSFIQINIKGPVIGGVRCFFEMFDPIIPHHGARLVGKRIKSSGIIQTTGKVMYVSGCFSFRFPAMSTPSRHKYPNNSSDRLHYGKCRYR